MVRKINVFLLIGIIITAFELFGQTNRNFTNTDRLILQIPDSKTKTTDHIAAYITEHFHSEIEKSRAVFTWIARNIEYDIDNMFAINFYQDTSEVIDEVMKSRRGICLHYAMLFYEIANKAGIKCYVITGYTRQNGFVDYIPHAWCAGLIDSKWYFFDPTWGAGFIQNRKFIKEVDDNYFMALPKDIIKSHKPYDPLWQFLKYPVTTNEFYYDDFESRKSRHVFNYIDTLMRYEQQSDTEKLQAAIRRINHNGAGNQLTFQHLHQLSGEIEYYRIQKVTHLYNSSVNNYNDGVYHLNQFIDYRNKQFTPYKPESEIRFMIANAEKALRHAETQLERIENPDAQTSESSAQLTRMINNAFENLNEQKAFVEKYFSTKKMFRKSLFYKYNRREIN